MPSCFGHWFICLTVLAIVPLRVAQAEWRAVFDARATSISGDQAEVWSSLRGVSSMDVGQAQWGWREQGDDWSGRVDAVAYRDGDAGMSISEAVMQWKPLPHSVWQQRARMGAFFPSLSVENTDAGWLSPWTLSFSAINGWIAEEVRNIGAEYTVRYAGRLNGGDNESELSLGVLTHDDVAGAALAWRGFRLTDRITGLGQSLALPTLPLTQVGQPFQRQADEIKPFRESDDRPGYYAQWQWEHQNFSLRWSRWDNRATAAVLEHGQYGWDTQFNHLALRYRLDNDWFLGAQAISGHSHMGPERSPNVLIHFDSAFLLLGWRGEIQQWAVRLESFNIDDHDHTPGDDNSEQGKAVTLAWSAAWTSHWLTRAEIAQVDSRRFARSYAGLEPFQTERIMQFSVQWQW